MVLALGAPALSFAVGDDVDDDQGRLDLNADVLINESVGAGTSGDFAIRGRLFMEDLSARADAQRTAAAARLRVVDGLDFAQPEASTDEYAAVREGLFEGYASEAHVASRESRAGSSTVSVLAVLVAVPVVLVVGAWLGSAWAKRKRASA